MTDSRKQPGEEAPSADPNAAVVNVATSLGPLVNAAAPKPEAARGTDSAPRHPRASPEERAQELAARKRVAALVSGGLHFKISTEDGRIQGRRGSVSSKVVARLTSKAFSPEVTLDLRGQPTADARDAIARFLTVQHRRGVKQLSIAFDPPSGEPSAEDAQEIIVAALTRGAASALVRAFSSARESSAKNAALAVLLI